MKPIVEWKRGTLYPALVFRFGKHLRTDDALIAIEEWRREFASKPGQTIDLIWEASEMAAYEGGARRAWQLALKEMRDQIGTVWLVSQSAVIRMGASVMSTFSSLDIKTVRCEDEIKLD